LKQLNTNDYKSETRILLNPGSGKVRKKIEQIKKIISSIPGIETHEASSLSEINQSIDRFIILQTKFLVIIGGDGTVQAVIDRYLTNKNKTDLPHILIIPGGTTNMTAKDIGIHGGPVKFVKRLKLLMLGKQTTATVNRSALIISQNNKPDIHGMFFGAGLISNGSKYFQNHIRKSGVTGELASFIVVLNFIFKMLLGQTSEYLNTVDVQLKNDERDSQKLTSLLLFATTLDRLLFGLKPYWGYEQKPVHFTNIKKNSNNFLRSLFAIICMRGASLLESDGYYSSNSQNIEIHMNGNFIIDGEIFNTNYHNGPLRISTTKPIKFVVP
jgi:diacylglycerol kinase (ATP)